MSTIQSLVTIIDDDELVLRALARVLKIAGYAVGTFSCADDYLRAPATPLSAGCIVLDQSMPGLSGLDLQRQLASQRDVIPILFLTGHADVPMSVSAMKAGAIDFLLKPVDEAALLASVARAMEVSRVGLASRQRRVDDDGFLARWRTLTPRETEVCALVTRGLLNKQIAGELEISEKTVKTHRGRVMTKLKVGSVAELVRLTERTACLPVTVGRMADA